MSPLGLMTVISFAGSRCPKTENHFHCSFLFRHPLRHGFDERVSHLRGDGTRMRVAQLEELFDKRDFGGGGIEAAECAPIVDNHAGANHVRTAIDSSGSDRNLQKRRQLFLILDRSPWMNQTSLIGWRAVRSHEHIVCDGLTE